MICMQFHARRTALEGDEVRFHGSATVGARGQVAIPASLRRELGIRPGDQVLFVQAQGDSAGFQVCLPGFALRGRLPAPVSLPDVGAGRADGEAPADLDASLAHLRAVELFRDLGEPALRRLAPLLRQERYRAGQSIVVEGQPCEAVYLIASGLVKRFKLSAEGKEQVLKLLGPGESFNEVPVLDGGPNPAGSVALEDTVVYALRRQDLLRLVEETPSLAMALLQVLAARLRHLVGLVEDLSMRHVMGRVARLLLDQPEAVERLTHQELAAMVGTVREVFSRAMRELEDQGAVRLDRGRVVILDRDRLKRLV